MASAGDVLEMSVVTCVGRVCDMCMCLVRGGRCWGEWVTGLGLEEHGESGICIYVLVAVLRVVLGESGWAAWARVWEGRMVLCLCVSGLSVLMAGPDGSSFLSSKQLAARFNQQLGTHTSSSETRLVTREKKR